MNNNTASTSTNFTNTTVCDIPDELCILGRNGMDFVIFSHHLGQVRNITYKELEDDRFLKTLLGIEFLQSHYQQEIDPVSGVSINYAKLRMHIEQLGDHNKHQFDSSKLRGVGVYKSRDGFVVNHGIAGVYGMNGKKLHNCHDGYFYLPTGDWGIADACSATTDDLKNFKKVFASFSFSDEIGPEILSSVVLAAMVSRALDFKPIIGLTADAGSGKTTLLSAIATAIGRPSVQYADSKQNAAKLRALLTTGPTALFIDEFESKTYRGEALSEMTNIFRASFSNLDDKCINTAIGCKANKIKLDAQVFLAAVQLPQLEPADLSRMINIRLKQYSCKAKPKSSSSENLRETIEQVAPKIRKLLIDNINELQMLVASARKKLSSAGLIERAVDKWSGVLGCAMLAERAASDNPKAAALILNRLTNVVLAYESRDNIHKSVRSKHYAECLLNVTIPAGPSGESLSLRQCLSNYLATAKDPSAARVVNAQLKQHGFAVTQQRGSDNPALAVSGGKRHSHNFSHFLEDCNGNKVSLEVCLADLCIEKNRPVTFADGGTQRAYILPIETLMSLVKQDMAA